MYGKCKSLLLLLWVEFNASCERQRCGGGAVVGWWGDGGGGSLKNRLALKFRKCFSAAEWNPSETKRAPPAYRDEIRSKGSRSLVQSRLHVLFKKRNKTGGGFFGDAPQAWADAKGDTFSGRPSFHIHSLLHYKVSCFFCPLWLKSIVVAWIWHSSWMDGCFPNLGSISRQSGKEPMEMFGKGRPF